MYICPPLGPAEGPASACEIGLQFVGIVGQGFEFFAGDDDRAGIVGGIHVDRGRGIGDLNFLGLDFDRHGHVEPQRLIGDDDVVVLVESESLSGDA